MRWGHSSDAGCFGNASGDVFVAGLETGYGVPRQRLPSPCCPDYGQYRRLTRTRGRATPTNRYKGCYERTRTVQ
jgi:hypothetical protein